MTPNAASPFQKILVLDSTKQNETSVALWQNGQVEVVDQPVRAQELQSLIEALLQKFQLNYKNLDAIAVLTGPGSYTGTRIGVATANTLAWLQDKPVISLAGDNLTEAIKNIATTSAQTAITSVT